MSDRSTRVFGPASMPTLDNPHQRPSPWACKPGAGRWWKDVQDWMLIPEDAGGTVAHLWWDGVRLNDTKGGVWSNVGPVPQVARNGIVPPGAGPFGFNPDKYYASPANGPLAFAVAPWTVVWVAYISQFTGYQAGLSCRNASQGFDSYVNSNRLNVGTGIAVHAVSGPDGVSAAINVGCFGYAGGTSWLAKLNLGALVQAGSAAFLKNASVEARIGLRPDNTVQSQFTTFYEIWYSTATPSDALFISIAQRVKNKLGITAW